MAASNGSSDMVDAMLAAAEAFKHPDTCTAEHCLTYWFGAQHSENLPASKAYFDTVWPLWFFGRNLRYDMAQRASRKLLARMAAGGCTGGSWNTTRGRLIQIIAMDQWSRVVYRGTTAAFQYDELACKMAHDMVNDGSYAELAAVEKFLVCVALSHAENRELSKLHADLGRKLSEGQSEEVAMFFDRDVVAMGFPHEHEECIQKFGRFPHRNALFGRESTPEELEWLNAPTVPGWAKSQRRTQLYYWDARGLADTVRFLLEFCMIPYDDVAVDAAVLKELKETEKLAFDQVPMLEIDGLRLVQTVPILRYVAGKKGLKGKTIAEEWAADAVVNAVMDSRMPLTTTVCKDEPGPAMEAWVSTSLPKISRQLERMLQGHGGPWMAGASLTYADVSVLEMYSYAREVCGTETAAELEKHPKLSGVLQTMGEYEHMQDFMKSSKRKPVHDAAFVQHVFGIMGIPLPKYIQSQIEASGGDAGKGKGKGK